MSVYTSTVPCPVVLREVDNYCVDLVSKGVHAVDVLSKIVKNVIRHLDEELV